jgi:phenylalanyl-tRNA synthetase beta chain
MRQSLIGSLLDVVSTNARIGRDDVAIFEVGKGYGATEDGEATHEWWRLGLALTGAAEPPTWDRSARPYDLDDAKGVIALVAERLGYPRPTYAPLTDDSNLHPGRAARVTAGERIAGRVGEVHPRVMEALDLRTGRILVAELAVAGLSGGQPGTPRVTSPSRHPIVERDLAVIVAEATPAADVEASIRRDAGPLLRTVSLFDIYRGRPLADDEKSLAYRLAFGADERTLVEHEVDAAIAAITTALATDVDGRLRT